MKMKKVIISAGGTGGHMFPAQSFARDFISENPDCTILFVGSNLSSNRFFDKTFAFEEIDAASFSKRKILSSSWKIVRGFIRSLKIIDEFRPDFVVGFGSFHTFPMLAAARKKKIPIFLHEQNSIPGKVNRIFSRKASGIGITFPITKTYLKGNCQLVIFPRKKHLQNCNDPYHYFGLDPHIPILLVFGGSQGAKFINDLLVESLSNFDSRSFSFQIIHFTGSKEDTQNCDKRYQSIGLRYCVKDFESRMDLAWSIASFAITRAGSATISELIDYEVPALLIPYPHATDNHQWHNGLFVQETVQGGLVISQQELKSLRFINILKGFMENDAKEIAQMKKNIAQYKASRENITFERYIRGIRYGTQK